MEARVNAPVAASSAASAHVKKNAITAARALIADLRGFDATVLPGRGRMVGKLAPNHSGCAEQVLIVVRPGYIPVEKGQLRRRSAWGLGPPSFEQFAQHARCR